MSKLTKKQRKVLYRIIASIITFVIVLLLPFEGIARFFAFLLPYLIIGWDVLWKAITNITRGQIFDENFLMTIATVGAFALGEYPEAVFVMLFYQIGELFQSYAVSRSRASITELMDIRPDYANIEKDGVLVQVDPEEVELNQIIVIKPGEKIPLDGVVVEGNAAIDTSALTGESVPRNVSEGDEVISGCISHNGLLKVRTTKLFGESTVSKILDLVENSSAKKAKTENFITKFARFYTPIVVFSALALAIIPSIITGSWSTWIERALIFLVISCPCALVISIPLTFFGGIGGASKIGVLVKGGNYLEALSEVDTMVFDKTGTLTHGSFKVVAVHPESVSEAELLEYTALAEVYSDHPISLSLKEAYEEKLDISRVKDFKNIAGKGVSAVVDNKLVLAGNDVLMTDNSISYSNCHLTGTIIHVAIDDEYYGHIIISDVIKPDSKEAIQSLKASGIKKTVMLTGDTKDVAEHVASTIGIDEVYSDLLPNDKVEKLEELLDSQKEKEMLGFVGDGINDAPVLSRADVGIAMGGLGSAAAIEAADVVIMDDSPSKIAKAMSIAKKTMRIARQNIVFSLVVKIGVLVLGALGLTNMWAAIFADVGVMVLAVINATRALRYRP